jgi:hypothetical protein
MKALSLSNLLAIGLALAVGEVQAGMWQSPGGSSPQQFNGQGREMVAPGSSGVSRPAFTGQGHGWDMQSQTIRQFEHPGHTIIHPQPLPTLNLGTRHGDSRRFDTFGHRAGFDRDRFHHHRNCIVVFVNSVPFWYPVYTDYPYYYDAPPPVTDNSAYYTADNSYVPPMDTSVTDTGTTQASPGYNELGASWGQDLRREVVTWDQFVAYLKAYVVTATPDSQADFREAFINAYRVNGAAAYDKASLEAIGNSPQPQGPKVITMPPAEN